MTLEVPRTCCRRGEVLVELIHGTKAEFIVKLFETIIDRGDRRLAV